MKKILIILMLVLTGTVYGQTNVLSVGVDFREDTVEVNNSTSKLLSPLTAACGTPFVSTGYPVFTNFWAGWMVKIINTNVCPIVINSFEARFQGTSGYRIYTKTGTFVGFETTAGAWTLVGTVASITGISTVAPTPIPIVVNVIIPAGGSQSFYLTRTDNLVANRHLYISGAGTAGTTVYASNADLSITEGCYVDPFFATLQVGVRRPSFDVCYVVNCVLPIEIISFTGENKNTYNQLSWSTASETNNDYFTLERSVDGVNWDFVSDISGAGNSTSIKYYGCKDFDFKDGINYYRLSQTDYNGQREYFNIVVIENKLIPKTIIKTTNMLGQELPLNFEGLRIVYYSDGTIVRKMGN